MGPEDGPQRPTQSTSHPAPRECLPGNAQQPESSSADALVNEFLHVYLADLDRGGPRSLSEYLALYPGQEEEIAQQLARVQATSAPAPEHIGPYRILGLIGEGGMGVVYRAEQREPIQRQVAIKVIKLGMDSVEVQARFELERQALAAMSHHGIAKVFDAGTSERGQPYFVMELVEGLPITTYCDKHRLSLAERIALFQQVCAGVQHAHQKGVIHRDLKPDNVLVVRDGDKATPRIIDFGLARATNRELLARTMYTEQDRVMGTPEYMAPEQAAADNEGIDTRADIYSLGVLLYELLAGELPFSSHELRRAGWVEIQHVLAEVEPLKPSTKLTSQGAAAAAHAERRRTSLSSLARELRGDLDWIVLKAIAKEPERRYDSATGLAMDLGRHLQHEPVLAGPPSARYRLRKLLRRYRTQAVAASLVFVTAVVGAVVAILLGLEAMRQEDIAKGRADEIEKQRNEIQSTATALHQRTEAFDMLSLVVHLRETRAAERRLYPATPDMVEALRAWLNEDVRLLREGLQQARATVEALRLHSDATAAEREASVRAHPRYPDLEELRTELAARRSAQDERDGKPRPAARKPSKKTAASNAIALNASAWSLIAPDRTKFGCEGEGLVLAELGHGKAIGEEVALLGNTLAWALFACGRDDDAMAASRAALEAAPHGEGAEYEDHLARIESAVDAVRGDLGHAALTELEREVDDLAGALSDWRFERRSDSFLHDTLSQLIVDGESFCENEVAAAQQRLSWAEHVERLTIQRFEDRWSEARAAITLADGVVASSLYRTHPIDLAPQMGLVPIAMNPNTKLWEFYHLRSAWDPGSGEDPAAVPIPTHATDGSIAVTGATGIVFVLVPGGVFTMGAQTDRPDGPNHDPASNAWEGPPHTVTLDPYFLARHELSQGQWKRLSHGQEPSRYGVGVQIISMPRPVTLAHPLENVDWPTARALLHRNNLVLPTEAQWDHACRAGTDTPWWTGRERATLEGAANFADLAAKRSTSGWSTIQEWFDDGFAIHGPVDALRANPWGFHAVHGNVWEWCRDEPVSYDIEPRAGDGLRPTKELPGRRNMRGGSYMNLAEHTRCAARGRVFHDYRDGTIGLRPAQILR